MDNPCELVRDLLPLYVDGLCSAASRRLVEEHVAVCEDCGAMLKRLRNSACEDSLRREAAQVMAPRRWRNRAFAVSCALAAFMCIPACLLAQSARSGPEPFAWLYLLAPSLLVVMSATVLPLRTRRYTGRWTLLGYTASLLLLMMVCCVYTAEGSELLGAATGLFMAGTAALYLLSAVVILPWALRELPLKGIFEGRKWLAMLVWDVSFALGALIGLGLTARAPRYWAMGLGAAGLVAALVAAEIVLARRLPMNRWVRAGLGVALGGNALGWLGRPLLALTGAERDVIMLCQRARLVLLLSATALGAVLVAVGAWTAWRRSGGESVRRDTREEKSI